MSKGCDKKKSQHKNVNKMLSLPRWTLQWRCHGTKSRLDFCPVMVIKVFFFFFCSDKSIPNLPKFPHSLHHNGGNPNWAAPCQSGIVNAFVHWEFSQSESAMPVNAEQPGEEWRDDPAFSWGVKADSCYHSPSNSAKSYYSTLNTRGRKTSTKHQNKRRYCFGGMEIIEKWY